MSASRLGSEQCVLLRTPSFFLRLPPFRSFPTRAGAAPRMPGEDGFDSAREHGVGVGGGRRELVRDVRTEVG